MKGQILDYSIQKNTGLISGSDGNRYIFTSSEWRSESHPEVNQIVDFQINGQNAIEVYLESTPVINLENIKEKLNTIGINKDNINAKIESTSKTINKFESAFLPKVNLFREKVNKVFLYGVASRTGIILSFILLVLLLVHMNFNSIFGSFILSVLTYLMTAIVIFMLLGFAYGSKKKTLSLNIGSIFLILVIYIGTYFNLEKSIMHDGINGTIYGIFGDNFVTAIETFGGGMAVSFVSMIGALSWSKAFMLARAFNIFLIPVLISIFLIVLMIILLKNKTFSLDTSDTNKRIDDKQMRSIKIFVVVMTLLFGFLGTFISRYIMGEKSLWESLLPTGIQLALLISLSIPKIGWILFLGGTIYIAYLNMHVVVNKLKILGK